MLINMSDVNAQDADCLFMAEQAVKAPSGHNTQPWLFKINSDNIEIHPNFEKSLPVVDPDNRELFISLGCAAENLCIAASQKGYEPKVSIAASGVITVDLVKNAAVKADVLFAQIAKRQTNRSEYDGKRISPDTLNILKETPKEAGANIRFYANGTAEFAAITDFVVRGNTAQMNDTNFVRELKSWMRFNKKHSGKTNDGLSYAVFGAPNLPMFIVKPIMSGHLNGKTQNESDTKRMRSASHFALLTTQSNSVEEWINLGRTLERFLLKSTELGIAHSYFNQPNEVKGLSVEMADVSGVSDYPAILLRVGYGATQPYSKRKAVKEVMIK
jgi:hypothetical protein